MIRIIDEARELLSTRILTRPTLNDMALIDTGLAAGQVAAKELAAARLHVDALQAEIDELRAEAARLKAQIQAAKELIEFLDEKAVSDG